jgi:hypothetical protein
MKNHSSHHSLFLLPFIFLFGLAVIAGLAGCGAHTPPPDCAFTSLTISPSSATANHVAASPGNQVNFMGFDGARPAACGPVNFLVAIRQDLKWTVSDAVNAKIGNTANVDYGIATCVNAAGTPITVTASGPNANGATITGTAALTCN